MKKDKFTILILAFDFPPKNSVGAQRPASWARYFPNNDIKPIVVTNNWGKIVKNEFPQAEIIQVNCNVSQKGIFLTGKVKSLFRLIFRFFSFRLDDKKAIYQAAQKFLTSNKVDAIIATGEPFILFRYASKLSKEFGIPWFADYRDDWIENHVRKNDKGLRKIILKLEAIAERKALKNVSGFSTVAQEIADQISNRTGVKSFQVIQNGADLDLYENREKPYKEGDFIIAYTGIFYDVDYMKTFKNGFINFLNSIDQNSKVKAYFIGVEAYKNRAYYDLLDLKAQLPNNVIILPRMSPYDVAAYQMHANVLLSLIPGDPGKGVIAAKTYNYAVTKNPILTIPTIASKTSSFFPQRDFLTIAVNQEEVLSFLKNKYNKWQNNQSIKTSITEEECRSISREFQSQKLLKFVRNS